ncbi:MAG: GFA family protein [Pseudomonadales bacterium]
MITGRCECAAVRFQVDGPVEDFSHCHCGQCRRLHGAAFVSFAGVAVSDFSYLSGENQLGRYKSSEKNTRVFCKNCGSNVLVASRYEPDSLYLSMGTLDDGDFELPPAYHTYMASKAAWFKFDDGAPRYDLEPDDS